MKLRKEGKRIELVTNVLGQPIGETSVDFYTYMGYLARNKVPLFVPSWPEIPYSILDAI